MMDVSGLGKGYMGIMIVLAILMKGIYHALDLRYSFPLVIVPSLYQPIKSPRTTGDGESPGIERNCIPGQ